MTSFICLILTSIEIESILGKNLMKDLKNKKYKFVREKSQYKPSNEQM